ncbi:unnamed protein product [Prorocentrum cordatum]|uniref:Uncharacterized protein n=1 Tax=Prorocentrum cordatum TaxID=2364126 RepID=A0ABN9UKK4_9DINO|nr:unnamed protein product [Polarella glacialis]
MNSVLKVRVRRAVLVSALHEVYAKLGLDLPAGGRSMVAPKKPEAPKRPRENEYADLEARAVLEGLAGRGARLPWYEDAGSRVKRGLDSQEGGVHDLGLALECAQRALKSVWAESWFGTLVSRGRECLTTGAWSVQAEGLCATRTKKRTGWNIMKQFSCYLPSLRLAMARYSDFRGVQASKVRRVGLPCESEIRASSHMAGVGLGWAAKLRVEALPASAGRQAPSKEQLKELGVGIPFSYALLGSMNSAVMVAVCWPIFVMRSGGSPLLFAPLKLNPKFAVYLSAVYFSYGSVSTPFLAIAAVAVAPFFNSTLKMLQERLNCPRWFALAVVTIGLAVVLPAFLVGAICLSCLVCRCPVLV